MRTGGEGVGMPKSEKVYKVRKPNITKQRYEEAKAFLHSNPIGQRVRAAENTLILLLKDDLPVLRHFIFNASYDLRAIKSLADFEKLLDANPNLHELLKLSTHGSHIRVSFDKEQIRFLLFYEKQLNSAEADLFSKSLGQVTAATFGALGLDMSNLAAIDDVPRPESAQLREMVAAKGTKKTSE